MTTIKKLMPEEELEKMATEVEIDLSQDVKTLQLGHTVKREPSFYMGNFSMTIGIGNIDKISLITIYGGTLVNKMDKMDETVIPADKRMVLFFDTEHETYQSYKIAKCIYKLFENDTPPHFKAYRLKKYTLQQRLEFIEYLMNKISNVGVVIIDGLRNLYSINDEEQATMITSKLRKWKDELKIEVIGVLHKNKGNNNASDQIETIMNDNVPYTVLYKKDKKIPQLSIVESTAFRGEKPRGYFAGIYVNSLTYLQSPKEI